MMNRPLVKIQKTGKRQHQRCTQLIREIPQLFFNRKTKSRSKYQKSRRIKEPKKKNEKKDEGDLGKNE